MSKAISITLTPEEEAVTLARIAAKTHKFHLCGSQCAACPTIIPADSLPIKGYASGQELGLCAKCASHVNTMAELNRAEKLEPGFIPKTTAIYAEPIIKGRATLAPDDE